MSRILYDGKRIIPAPLVNIIRDYQKSGNGEIVGTIYTLTLTGSIIAYMGSPTSSGTFWTASGYPGDETIAADDRLGAIQRKQEAIRYLFGTEGKQFEIQSSISYETVKCNPRILSINFPEGIWYDKCEYIIELECDELYGGPFDQPNSYNQYISDASEEWSIDTNEDSAELFGIPKTYSLSHTVSAQGKRFYDETGELIKQPWQYAQDFVLSRIGFDATIALSSGVNNIPSYYQGLNHVRNENIDKQGGGYSVTENWVLASGTATEDFTVQTSDSLDTPYKKVTIDGNITGYDQRDSNLNLLTDKWNNASTKFVQASGLAYIRAQQFSGLSLNILPLSETIGRNPIQGTINYNYEYDTRPTNFVSAARSEVISIQDNLGGELFASVFVLGRAKGPVLQALSTKPANTRTLNIELVLNPVTGTAKELINDKKPTIDSTYSTDIQSIMDAANPENNGFTTVFQDQTQENWDIKNFRYTYSTNWTFE